MKKIYLLMLLFCPLFSEAQKKTFNNKIQVNFTNAQNWSEVIKLAKMRNKMIFVDAFTTWCGPCKELETVTFKNDTIANFFNTHFINVRIQFDSTKKDSKITRQWYRFSKLMTKTYQINAYPTMLFFDKKGNPIHKLQGLKDAKELLVSAQEVISNPESQYFSLVRSIKFGSTKYDYLSKLIRSSAEFHDTVVLKMASRLFIENFFSHEDQLFNKSNADLLGIVYKYFNPEDWAFKSILNQQSKIDSIYEYPKLATRIIGYRIAEDYIRPAVKYGLKIKSEPNWGTIKANIEQQYPFFSIDGLIQSGKIDYYKSSKQWPLYSKAIIKRINQSQIIHKPHSLNKSMTLNNSAMQIVGCSDSIEDLHIALMWMDKIIAEEDEKSTLLIAFYDTKANLLYKLGKKAEGITLEEKVLKLENGSPSETAATLKKMKAGLPTWELPN